MTSQDIRKGIYGRQLIQCLSKTSQDVVWTTVNWSLVFFSLTYFSFTVCRIWDSSPCQQNYTINLILTCAYCLSLCNIYNLYVRVWYFWRSIDVGHSLVSGVSFRFSSTRITWTTFCYSTCNTNSNKNLCFKKKNHYTQRLIRSE